jgi:hypothetical protein
MFLFPLCLFILTLVLNIYRYKEGYKKSAGALIVISMIFIPICILGIIAHFALNN